MTDGHFGEEIAAGYDGDDGEFDPVVVAATADLLAGLTNGGRALELAIGTGRVALPLRQRGVEVHGVDMSRAMVARLRARPGGDAVPVTIGDMATARVGDGFDLVYLIFNTIMNLTTQDAQVECFRTAAAHLRPGGRFLVEVMVPELRKLPPGQTVVPFLVTEQRWGFDRYDVATQAMSSNHFTLDGDRGTVWTIPFRYVWPAELDLMARLAGLAPEHRWESWSRAPFTGESSKHISIWRKPD
jgi:SAM-dependent methyltransferase